MYKNPNDSKLYMTPSINNFFLFLKTFAHSWNSSSFVSHFFIVFSLFFTIFIFSKNIMSIFMIPVVNFLDIDINNIPIATKVLIINPINTNSRRTGTFGNI